MHLKTYQSAFQVTLILTSLAMSGNSLAQNAGAVDIMPTPQTAQQKQTPKKLGTIHPSKCFVDGKCAREVDNNSGAIRIENGKVKVAGFDHVVTYKLSVNDDATLQLAPPPHDYPTEGLPLSNELPNLQTFAIDANILYTLPNVRRESYEEGLASFKGLHTPRVVVDQVTFGNLPSFDDTDDEGETSYMDDQNHGIRQQDAAPLILTFAVPDMESIESNQVYYGPGTFDRGEAIEESERADKRKRYYWKTKHGDNIAEGVDKGTYRINLPAILACGKGSSSNLRALFPCQIGETRVFSSMIYEHDSVGLGIPVEKDGNQPETIDISVQRAHIGNGTKTRYAAPMQLAEFKGVEVADLTAENTAVLLVYEGDYKVNDPYSKPFIAILLRGAKGAKK